MLFKEDKDTEKLDLLHTKKTSNHAVIDALVILLNHPHEARVTGLI